MSIEEVLIKNGASIFADHLEEYQEVLSSEGQIFIPLDKSLLHVLKDLDITLEEFEQSTYFNEIIRQHVMRALKKFRVTNVNGQKEIDGIPIVKTVKLNVDGAILDVSFIDGILLMSNQVEDLRSIAVTVNPTSNVDYGQQIYMAMANRYRDTLRLFKSAEDDIALARAQRKVTSFGEHRLRAIIRTYANEYKDIVERIQLNKTYLPIIPDSKAKPTTIHFGKKAMQITNAQSWADACIELSDLVRRFSEDLNEMTAQSQNVKTLEKECSQTDLSKCEYPCNLKKSFTGKKTCQYKK